MMSEDQNLEIVLEDLHSEIDLDASYSGDLKAASFFRIYHELAVDNGDFPDLEYTPAINEGKENFRVDGVAVDADRREAFLAISDFRQSGDLETIDAARLEQNFKRAERFFQAAVSPVFINSLEEMSPAFQAAYTIYSNSARISRIRIVLLSNARLSTRKKTVEARDIGDRTFTYSVLDVKRYADILASMGGAEPLDIDILELNSGNPIPCLPAHATSVEYRSYLVALPATLLSEIYGRYGARLLEQNVRSFLQARTKVNRGILDTIANEPGMFFAYNNGLTVTASGIELGKTNTGADGLTSISNMQIVNGGQTTASILYARDLKKSDLDSVYVQMKLSVVDPDRVEEIVPKISRYANTQNRVSEADFFSSHAFHVEMERMSRRVLAPPKAGHMLGSKWFYERARGQYVDKRAYGTAAQKKKFEIEYPKDQLITKTDAAKFITALNAQPHKVSQGAQKCFLAFANEISERWGKYEDPKRHFNDAYFKDLVSSAILFKWCDHMIGRSEWYQNDRGYKAQTVAYSVAWLSNWGSNNNATIDLERIWKEQALPGVIQTALKGIAPIVASAIRDAPAEIKNIGEYTKREMCWKRIRDLEIDMPHDLASSLLSKDEVRQRTKDASAEGEIDGVIQLEKLAMSCMGSAEEIRNFAKSHGFLSPKSDRVLTKISQGKLMSPADAAPWRHLVKNLRKKHYEFPKMEE